MSKSKQNGSEEYPLPTEPPELVAKRDRLLATLEKEAKAATGTAQPVLRKMHELLSNTKVGSPLNAGLYQEVKDSFVRFMKDPVLPPPAIIMEVVEFLQERLVTVGFTGQMEWPEGAPPVPAGFVGSLLQGTPAASAPAAAAPAQRGAGGVKDGFEGSSSQRKMTLNPETAPAPAAASTDPKSEQQQLESFKTWMKNPALGKVKG